MTTQELTLEKINSERITQLEERFDRRLEGMEKKIDRIAAAVGAKSDIRERNGNGNSAWIRQSIGITIAVVALLGFMIPTMVSIVKPIQQQLDMMSDRISLNEEHSAKDGHPIYQTAKLKDIINEMEQMAKRADNAHIQLDDKLQMEIAASKELVYSEIKHLDKLLQTEIKSTQDRLDIIVKKVEELEEWQKWWYRTSNNKQGT